MSKPAVEPYGRRTLKDGSIIYRSGCDVAPVRPGKFFAWLRTGSTVSNRGDLVATGEVLFEGPGIRYFDSPQEALSALDTERRKRGLR